MPRQCYSSAPPTPLSLTLVTALFDLAEKYEQSCSAHFIIVGTAADPRVLALPSHPEPTQTLL